MHRHILFVKFDQLSCIGKIFLTEIIYEITADFGAFNFEGYYFIIIRRGQYNISQSS